jgi:hypothetical protein
MIEALAISAGSWTAGIRSEKLAFAMASIFISYRKGGSDDGSSYHLAEDLRKALGPEHMFRDEKGLRIGLFEDQLLGKAQSCRCMIVVIGPEWIERLKDLRDPGDWVRREVEVALKRKVLMVPFILEGGRLPKDHELPDSMQKLLSYQVVRTDQRHWNDDVSNLIDALAGYLGLERQDTAASIPNLSGSWVDTDGVPLRITHQGDDIHVAMLDFLGRTVGQGRGTLSGNQIEFSINRPDLGPGSGRATVSPDGRQISGQVQYGMDRYGFSMSKR